MPAQANALRLQLEAAQPSVAAQANVAQIKLDMDRLDPDLDMLLGQANEALSRSAAFFELSDLQRRLTDAAAPLGAWESFLETEAKRVAKALGQITQAQQVWSATQKRPETVASAALIGGSVKRSIYGLEQATVSLNAWRAHVLILSERVTGRIAAINAMNDRLQAAEADQRANLFVPRGQIWQSGYVAELRAELPRVPGELIAFGREMREYAAHNRRPLILQALLAVLLMLGFGRLAARVRKYRGPKKQGLRLLDRPYAVGLLVALLATPFIHPLAPHGFVQAFGIAALLPTARIVVRTGKRSDLAAFVGLLIVALLDRLSLAVAPLPAIGHVSLLLVLAASLGLAFWFKGRLRHDGSVSWLRRTVNLVMLMLALSFVAGLCGWSDLATLVGRGTMASIYSALYIFAVISTLEPFIVYVLSTPAVSRIRIFERNTALLQRQVEHGLRWLGGALWIFFVLRATGLADFASTTLRAILNLGVSVGAFALTIGGLLAFVVTLMAARFLTRIIDEILREDIYPHRSLPRGMADAVSALVRYGIYTLGFLIALSAAGIQLSQLSILLGGFGIGLGLGLQDLVRNFAAGLTLLSERRLNVGDQLQIPGQEIFGQVRLIGMRATVVRNLNGSEVIVPNANLVSSVVTNWTLSDRLHRVDVPVGVAYGTDPAVVVGLLVDAARSNNQVLQNPAPQALFKGFGDSSLNFELRAWTDEDYEMVTSDLALAVHRRLFDAAIEIPFPQHDLHLTSVSPEVRAMLSGREPKDVSGPKRPLRATPKGRPVRP
ncbi:MAG TPA: mechanosensitive ion channel domain-containing protein [Candidatus Binataceae bacterium]|nr:mechanosensitive ion channel domain-containing protein [Candidatus Binataceae bacterium]